MKKSEYDSKKGRVVRHPLSSSYNTYIQAVINKVIQAEQEAILKEQYFSLEEAKSIAEGRKISQNSKLIDYINNYVAVSYNTNQIGSRANFKYLNQHIHDFAGEDLSIFEVNNSWGRKFKSFLSAKLKPSTVNKNLSMLRQIFNYAIDDTQIDISSNPLRSLKLAENEVNIDKRKALTDEELLRIERTTLPDKFKLTRDVFLTCYYLGGVRISDVLQLKAGSLISNRYKATKTGKFSAIVKHDKLLRVLEPYLKDKTADQLVFPALHEDQLARKSESMKAVILKTNNMNHQLAKISKICQIPFNVTTKTARQTFAQRVVELEDKKLASMVLNHSDEKVTEAYLDHFNALEYAINKLFVS